MKHCNVVLNPLVTARSCCDPIPVSNLSDLYLTGRRIHGIAESVDTS